MRGSGGAATAGVSGCACAAMRCSRPLRRVAPGVVRGGATAAIVYFEVAAEGATTGAGVHAFAFANASAGRRAKWVATGVAVIGVKHDAAGVAAAFIRCMRPGRLVCGVAGTGICTSG